jgi:hypothetical protein
VRAAEPARGGGRQPALLPQVDGHPAARELGDALDGRLERVREREPRDRLADDGDHGLRARQRERRELGAPALPEGDGGAAGEGGQAVEGLGRRLLVEVELERAHRRLAQRDRHGHVRPTAHGVAPALVDRPLNRLGRRGAVRDLAVEAVHGEHPGRGVRLDAPGDGGDGACGLGCQTRDLRRRLGFVRTRRERIARRLEGKASARSVGAAAAGEALELGDRGGLRGGEAREREHPGRERAGHAIELEDRDRRARRAGREDPHGGRSRPGGRAPKGCR